ncbi:hypothetical protein WDU94_007972 [Cyamophila willieti]
MPAHTLTSQLPSLSSPMDTWLTPQKLLLPRPLSSLNKPELDTFLRFQLPCSPFSTSSSLFIPSSIIMSAVLLLNSRG